MYCPVFPFTVVGDYINTIKTTFDLIFDLYQAWIQREAVKVKIQKKLVNN